MELHDLAAHGVISIAEAVELGMDSAALRRLARAGTVHRLIRGWYAVCPQGARRPPWQGADDFETKRLVHRLRTIALVRPFEGRAVASHHSAAVLHGLPTWRADLETVHLCRSGDDHSRHRAGAVIHPATGSRPVTTQDGLATVPVGTAIVQVGLIAAASDPAPAPMESLVVADAALHRGLVTSGDIERALKLHRRHPNICAVRGLLVNADGRHESPGETRLAQVLRHIGVAATPQVPVARDGSRFRVDFLTDDAPVIIEFDGKVKYGSADDLFAEKRREDLLRSWGYEVVRIAWADLDDPARVSRLIAAARTRSRRARSA